MQDSKSNRKSVFATLGASNHSDGERAHRDLYCTHPSAVEALLKVETFSRDIWEPAAGLLHISKTLEEHGHRVRSSDIEARCEGVEEKDFLFMDCEQWWGDIITNPPYSTAGEFVLKSLQSVEHGSKVAMLLRLLFLEGQQRRREIFENAPPHTVYVFSRRTVCAKNGDFSAHAAAAQCFAWFVWIKGWKGDTTVKWI